jgi:hypothetical protein
MNNTSLRIPIPSSQRWERLRTRVLPVLCLAATLLLCGLLWRRQALQMPLVIGEVQAVWQDVQSPADGKLLSVEKLSNGAWPAYTNVSAGETVVRIQPDAAPTDAVEVSAPISGAITAQLVQPGEQVRAGQPILRIAAERSENIVCHLPELWQKRVKPRQQVWIRHREGGEDWLESVIAGIGPLVEQVPVHQLPNGVTPSWGLPILIEMPPALVVKPGSLVEVRF